MGVICMVYFMPYGDVIMGVLASQIISLTIVYSNVYSGRSKKTSKLGVTGLCAGNSPVNSPHKWPVTRIMFPFHDVHMRVYIMVNAIGITTVIVTCWDGLKTWIDWYWGCNWYNRLHKCSVVPKAGTNNYIPPHNLWDIINCPCLWYLLVEQHSW